MIGIDSIIVALITATSTLIGVYLKERFYPKLNKQELTIQKSESYIDLDKICFTIRKLTKANGVYIAYFHNGGSFINGVRMDKYTVVGEDYCENLKSYKGRYKDCLVNNFTYLFHNLLVDNRHFIPNVDADKSQDKFYKDDLVERGIKSSYTFLIKDPIEETPVGFISIEYNETNAFNLDNEKYIWKYQNKIANILNINKYK